MRFRLLGTLVVETERGDLTLERRRERSLLGILLLHNNTAMPAERLVYLLWDGDPVPSARRQLHGHVSRVRKVLRGTSARLHRVGNAYRLEVEDTAIDARVFSALVTHARSIDDPSERCRLLRQALDMWTGDVLVDAISPWLRSLLVSDLQELRWCATEEWLAAGVAAGAHTELLPELIRMAKVEPSREVIVGLSMRALHLMGRDADALGLFREHRTVLADQFGLDPGHELQELHLSLLRGERLESRGRPASPNRSAVAPAANPPETPDDTTDRPTLEPVEDGASLAPANLPVLWTGAQRAPVPVMRRPAPARSLSPRPAAQPPSPWRTPFHLSAVPVGALAPRSGAEPKRQLRQLVMPILVAVALLTGLVGGILSGRELPRASGPRTGPVASAPAVARIGEGPVVASPTPTNSPTPSTSPSATPAVTPAGATNPASPPPTSAGPASTAAEQPAGADEFSTGTFPDPARWSLYTVTDPNGASWSPAAIHVVDGELRIVGHGTNPTGAGNVSGGMCWCGEDGNQLYGKWQVRAKFDAGAGYGPVIGLWPKSENASDGFVTFGQLFQPDRRNMKCFAYWAGGSGQGTLTGDFTGWHTYTVEWRASSVKIFIDHTLVYDSAHTPGFVAPQEPMHLVLQQMVGPRGDGVPAPDATTPEQVVMHIDWVRYYR
jgi:DNA-binding SARP family transcriptional activator/beta-glucanase (GH16 family)